MPLSNKHLTFCDDIIGDGITYRYIVSHMLNSYKIMSQIIQSQNGIELPKDKYTLIRKTPNVIVIEFTTPPLKEELLYVLLIKVG